MENKRKWWPANVPPKECKNLQECTLSIYETLSVFDTLGDSEEMLCVITREKQADGTFILNMLCQGTSELENGDFIKFEAGKIDSLSMKLKERK